MLFDSSNRGYWLNELSLMLANELETSAKMSAFETVLTGLDSCSDAIQIVDNVNESIIYQNPCAEKLTGYTLAEMTDKRVWDFQGTASETVLNENDEVLYQYQKLFETSSKLLAMQTRLWP